MVDMIGRMEELTTALGVSGVEGFAANDKNAFCDAAKNFRSQTKKAQDAGVRAMGGYLPYLPTTADGKTGAFIASPERDTVLAMLEELGMAILHNDVDGAYEYFTDADFTAGTLPFQDILSNGDPPVPYYVDFWLYDDRVTLDFVSDEFKAEWPHVALVAEQYAYFPANARVNSYKHATEILERIGAEIGKATKLNMEETTCTPADTSGDEHRTTGLSAGEYACWDPVEYDFCTIGSFVDDTGSTITWSGSQPTIITGAMDAVAFSHFGMSHEQILGVFGEQSSSGSNYGNTYFDGNVNNLIDHGLLDHDPSLFPADPNEEERAFLNSIALDLSPGCSGTNYYCSEINIDILNENGWPDLVVVGSFYGSLLSDEFREAALEKGVPIITITDSYNSPTIPQVPRSMVDMIGRMEELTTALGVSGVEGFAANDKNAFCDAAKNFRSQTKKAQDAGVRAMGGYLPYLPTTADGKTGAFIASPERDTVLAMLEELGMAILHNDVDGAYEYFTDADFTAGTLPFQDILSNGDPPVPYYVDFWLYDDRVTLDFVSDEFKAEWPHVALVAEQYAYFPANARVNSYKHATEILERIGAEIGKATKLNMEETTCTPADTSGDEHRTTGLSAGEYACYDPVEYDFCVEGGIQLCLSAATVVDVLGKGDIRLENLQIGDRIQVDDGKYETVYGFGHRDTRHGVRADYISLSGKGMKRPLEISDDHMVFVVQSKNLRAVPASTIRVGDHLRLVNGEDSEIMKIKKIHRSDGAFAPFTPSGKFVANGVVVSSYVSLQKNNDVLKIASTETPFTMQWLAHVFEAPHRMICSVATSFCKEETYDENGISAWVSKPLQLALWTLEQSAWIQIPLVTIFLAVATLLWAIEIVSYNYLFSLTIIAAIYFVGQKKKMLQEKQ